MESMPQWKRDLIMMKRRKLQQQQQEQQHQKEVSISSSVTVERSSTGGHQPITNACCAAMGSSSSGGALTLTSCNTCCECHKMVQVHTDSEEELQYGPGIVNKLKNRYLSLTLREASAKTRPSILRKATSLENLLEADEKNAKGAQMLLDKQRLYESRTNGTCQKNVLNRYRPAARGNEMVMKRARSVEAISHVETTNGAAVHGRPKSEDFTNPVITPRINRPKRLTPIITEREKPPVDVVKQTKKLFEGRPEQRTAKGPTVGDVATKVANFKSIITNSKPSITKPKPSSDKKRLSPLRAPSSPPPDIPVEIKKAPISPIPDVSMVNEDHDDQDHKKGSLSLETPDLILHSSPTHQQQQPKEFLNGDELLKERKSPSPDSFVDSKSDDDGDDDEDDDLGYQETISPVLQQQSAIVLSPREIEKNLINASKSSSVVISSKEDASITNNQFKKKPRPQDALQQQNSIVFKFTDRKDVPDYVQNDGSIRNVAKMNIPKAGESGITILPGLSIEDVFGNQDDFDLLSLEGPPSPCNVIFINDNVLIDGKSSLSQKSSKRRSSQNQTMRIKFEEAVPQIFEYPSEASMLQTEVDVQQPPPYMGINSPSILGGSNLANYTPKSSFNDFQLGVTKTTNTANNHVPNKSIIGSDEEQEKTDEEPILFSAGSNSDILF